MNPIVLGFYQNPALYWELTIDEENNTVSIRYVQTNPEDGSLDAEYTGHIEWD